MTIFFERPIRNINSDDYEPETGTDTETWREADTETETEANKASKHQPIPTSLVALIAYVCWNRNLLSLVFTSS
jgi:hypothetical protein